MLKKICFIFFYILLLSACNQTIENTSIDSQPILTSRSPSTLHAIILADTNNETIGTSVEIDMNNIKNLLETIKDNTGLQLETQSIDENRFTRDDVIQAVNNLRVNSDDVIFFYYSGHGVNRDNGSEWPSMLINNQLTSLDSIITQLSMKKPRFLMVLSDSCNDFMKNISDISKDRNRGRAKPENYRQLFLNYRGYIIASSSIPGQKSWGNNYNGGLFTHAFISSLDKNIRSDNPNWRMVMEEATKPLSIYTLGRRDIQQPQFKREIERIRERRYEQAFSIQILPSQQFRVGESMQIQIDNPSNEEKYLFIWDINSHGEISRIIPNQYTKEKSFPTGTTIISKKTMGFDLKIVEPLGNNALVAALVKKESIQDILNEQIENLPATNTQTALQQLQQGLNQILGQNNGLIATIDYEISL